MSQAEGLGGPAGWLVAGALAVFVTGITWISRSETESGLSPGLLAGLGLENLAILALLLAALQARAFPTFGEARPAVLPLEGMLVILLVAWMVNLAGARALRDPVPSLMQSAVKTGVLSLVWLNFGVVAAVRGPATAAAVAVLWVPAFVLSRWLYAT
jgi:4-hydroxybenzoate polyprenyltransferase